MIKKFCAALALTLIATGCGTQFGGNYSGTAVITSGTTLPQSTLTMTLYQTGTAVSGHWQATSSTTGVVPITGSLTGTASGSTLQSVAMTVPSGEQYAGNYLGTLTLSGNMITGSVTGSPSTAGGSLTLAPTATQSR